MFRLLLLLLLSFYALNPSVLYYCLQVDFIFIVFVLFVLFSRVVRCLFYTCIVTKFDTLPNLFHLFLYYCYLNAIPTVPDRFRIIVVAAVSYLRARAPNNRFSSMMSNYIGRTTKQINKFNSSSR